GDSHGTTHARPSPDPSVEEWVLVDGTPASCVQIGLYHFFQSRGPVDLVVSGPNYGRNTTAVFALSSGTLGGALEAAVCKRRAVALSYAFFSRNHDGEIIAAASRRGADGSEELVAGRAEGGIGISTSSGHRDLRTSIRVWRMLRQAMMDGRSRKGLRGTFLRSVMVF